MDPQELQQFVVYETTNLVFRAKGFVFKAKELRKWSFSPERKKP